MQTGLTEGQVCWGHGGKQAVQHSCMACQRVQVGSALFQGASQAVAAAHAADAQHLVVVKGQGNSVCRRSNGESQSSRLCLGRVPPGGKRRRRVVGTWDVTSPPTHPCHAAPPLL
jgi:hypothetical protein